MVRDWVMMTNWPQGNLSVKGVITKNNNRVDTALQSNLQVSVAASTKASMQSSQWISFKKHTQTHCLCPVRDKQDYKALNHVKKQHPCMFKQTVCVSEHPCIPVWSDVLVFCVLLQMPCDIVSCGINTCTHPWMGLTSIFPDDVFLAFE